MEHDECKIVRWHLSFKERDHVHTDGTRRGQKCEVALVLQRARSRTDWWHTKRPKSWGSTCPSKSETTYILMAHKEAKIVRWHLSFREWDHVLPDLGSITGMSESPSKWLDSNALIHRNCETWNAEITWDARFRAYLQMRPTLCPLRQ